MSDEPKQPSKDWHEVLESDQEAEVQESDEVGPMGEVPKKEAHKQEEEPQGSLEHPDYTSLEQRLTETEQKLHEHWEKYVRAQAELENLHRLTERRVQDARKFSIEKLAIELLPVIDSFERAMETTEGGDAKKSALREGLELTHKMLIDSLAKFSIRQVNPVGEVFDPSYHEAVSMQADPDAKAGTVLTVIQKGYTLHERLIRPAMVIVAEAEKAQ